MEFPHPAQDIAHRTIKSIRSSLSHDIGLSDGQNTSAKANTWDGFSTNGVHSNPFFQQLEISSTPTFKFSFPKSTFYSKSEIWNDKTDQTIHDRFFSKLNCSGKWTKQALNGSQRTFLYFGQNALS